MKTVRFATLVEKAGKPEHHLAWAGAENDPALKKAAKETRLLSIHQQVRGARKDFGQVGLETGRDVQYFVFPRSLKRFADARIVGVDYELAGEALTFGPTPAVKRRPPAKSAQAKAPAPPNVIEFPRGAPDPAEPKTRQPEKPAPPPPPPPVDWAGVAREISAALRELGANKKAAARNRLTALAERLPR